MGSLKSGIDNLCILLVEDDLVSQFLMKETLHIWNKSIEIALASNGKEAIEILKNKHCDLIFMDIQMPVMDGYETTEIIRTKFPPAQRNIPIIAMTGQVSFQYKDNGMNDFISKPFEAETLFATIEKIIAEHTIIKS